MNNLQNTKNYDEVLKFLKYKIETLAMLEEKTGPLNNSQKEKLLELRFCYQNKSLITDSENKPVKILVDEEITKILN